MAHLLAGMDGSSHYVGLIGNFHATSKCLYKALTMLPFHCYNLRLNLILIILKIISTNHSGFFLYTIEHMLMTRKLCTSQPRHKVSGTGLISRVTISGEITIMHLSITRYPHFYFCFENCLKGKMEILIMITYACIAF